MKSKLKSINFSLFILFALFSAIKVVSSFECYSTKMKKVFLDTSTISNVYNFQNKIYLAKIWRNWDYWGSGYSYSAFNSQIDFKRNVHVYLKDHLDFYWELCNTLYGTTVILGTHNYPMPSYDQGLMVSGLTESLVIAFQNNKNQISLYDCLKTKCDINRPKLSLQYTFSYFATFNFHVIYDYAQKKLLVYKDVPLVSSNRIIEYSVDLASKFPSGMGYMGLSATYKTCAVLHDITGSFICLNGGEKITPQLTLSYENVTITPGQTISVPASSKVNLKVKYSTKNEKELMGPGKLLIDGIEYDMTSMSDDSYTFAFFTGTQAGTYNEVKYSTTYETFEFSIKIESGEPSQIVYFYQKRENEGNCFYFDENNNRILQYGSLAGTKSTCGGDFDVSDFIETDGFMKFVVQTYDKYGNKVQVDVTQKSIFTDLIATSTNSMTVSVIGDYTYEITISVEKQATYKVSSSYLDNTIIFYVKDYVPSSSSFCKLEERQYNFYLTEQTVTYNCFYKDRKGEDNIIETSKKQLPLKLSAKVVRIPTNEEKEETFDVTLSEKCTGASCTYTFTTKYNGKYKFIASYEMKTIKADIDSSFNIFYVVPIPLSFRGSRIYNYDTNKWVDEPRLKDEIFIFNEFKTTDDKLFAIELVDENDPHKTPYSDIQYGYETFMPNELIKGTISEEHSGYSTNIELDYDIIDNKKYLVCLLKNSKEEIRRTSFPYKINLALNESKITVTLKILLNKVGEYTACRKDLVPSNCKIDISSGYKLETTAGVSLPVGKLVLQTGCENHLYNYFIEDESHISFKAYYKQTEEECTDCIMKTEQNPNVYGVYDLQFTSEKANEYIIYGQIDGIDLLEGKNKYEVKVLPLGQAYYLYKIEDESEDEKEYNADNPIEFGFVIKDQYENVIDYELTSSDLDNNLGLVYSLKIGDVDYTSLVKNKGYIKFLKNKDGNYLIEEHFTKTGQYSLVISTKYSSNKLVYNYYKGPGAASILYSKIKVINSNQLNLGTQSSVQVFLYDSYENFIGNDLTVLEKEIQKVEIVANGHKDIILTYPNKYLYEETSYVFKSEDTIYQGSYYVSGTIEGKLINICLSCSFEVVDYGFSFQASQLKMIDEKISIMTENGYYTLFEGLQRPAFEFDFLTKEGLESGKVDVSCGVIASIINAKTQESIDLSSKWISNNKLFWSIPDDYLLESGNDYYIKISSDKEAIEKKYYIKIVKYGQDEGSSSKYDISKTLISPNILYLRAGISDTFLIEFKDENGYRYNNDDLELNLLSIEIPDNLKQSVSITKKNGVKNGQFIIEINSKKSCVYTDYYNLTIIYNDEMINNKVILVTSPGELNYFKIDSSCLLDPENYILNPATVDSLPKINLLPFDKYDNLISESVFNSQLYPEDGFGYMFNLMHSNKQKVSVTSSINPLSNFVVLSLLTEKEGKITLSSNYLKNEYVIEIKPGQIGKQTIGYLKDMELNTIAGTQRIFVIEPRDKYGNLLTNTPSVNEFDIKIYDLNGNIIEEIENENKIITDENFIECTIDNQITGTKIIKAFYDNDTHETILYNNVINTINSDVSLELTKIIYNNQEFPFNEDSSIQISLSSLPIIDIQLYDNQNNKIIDPSTYEIDFALDINGNQIMKSIYFNSVIRLYIDETQINNYFNINTENEYELLLSMNTFGVLKKKIKFIGQKPRSNTKQAVTFSLNSANLEILTGEKGIINLSFYNSEGNLVGNFFDDISSNIQVNCGNDYPINTEIYYGSQYGKYNLVISSKTKTEGTKTCTISSINKVQQISLVIKSNEAKKCQIVDNENKELLNLDDVSTDEKYKLRVLCFDQYKNIAKINPSLFSFYISYDFKKKILTNSEVKINSDDSLNLIIYPTIVSKYYIISTYFNNEEKTFNTFAGEISEENSYVEVTKTAKAGDDVYVYINCLDKNNNRINFDIEDDKFKTLFDVYYRYQEKNGFSDYHKITEEPLLVNEDNKSYIKYKVSLFAMNINEFRAIYQKTSTIIKCDNCEINVEPNEISLEKSDIYKYNSFSNTYKKIEAKDEIFYNYKEKLLIRIYPKDPFGNYLNANNYRNSLNVAFNEENLSLVDEENNEFLEFGGDFSQYEYGEYDFSLKYNENIRNIKIFIAGNPDSEKFVDKNLDLNRIKLLDSNLEFTVGEYGYFNFEIRNQNNIRLNDKLNLDLQIIADQELIDTTIINKYSSTIIVLFTSKKANLFPTKTKNELKVIIDDKSRLNLEIYAHPGELNSAKINPIYLQTEQELIPTSVDNQLKFSVIGYDLFSNQCPIEENSLKLILKSSSNEEVLYLSSSTDIISREQIYTYELTKIGIYSINAGTNSEGKNLFEIPYTIEMIPGSIDPEKTIIQINDGFITAGQETSITIYPKDQYNNNAKIDEKTSNDFIVFLLADNQEKIEVKESKYTISEIRYSIQLILKGEYSWNFELNNEKINCYKCTTTVKPSICQLENTLISTRDNFGDYKIYEENKHAYSSINSPLSVHLNFRDKYNNIIDSIKEEMNQIKVTEAYLSGNNMETNLYWTPSINNDYSQYYIDLDISNEQKKHIFEHLVSRKDDNAYIFKFTVNYNLNKVDFEIKVNHIGKNENEDEYGNGKYSIEKSTLSEEVALFKVGKEYEILLELRTNEGLLYNDEIDINTQISCNNLLPKAYIDKTFTCQISKKNTKVNGIYSIQYYSEKRKTSSQYIYNEIKLANPDTKILEEFKQVQIINVIGVPCRENTKIVNTLPPKLNDNTNPVIEYILQDRFGNVYETPEDIRTNLRFVNHDVLITHSTIISADGKTYKSTLIPQYPPKDVSIQLLYVDSEDVYIPLFLETQNSTFEYNVDYYQTLVTSKNVQKMSAGDLLDMQITLYDEKGQCYLDEKLDSSLISVTVQGPLESSTHTRKYNFFRVLDEHSVCKYYYKIDIDDSNKYTKAGTYSVIVYTDKISPASYTQMVTAGVLNTNNFEVSFEDESLTPSEIKVGTTFYFYVRAFDSYGNQIDYMPISDFEIVILDIEEKAIPLSDYTQRCINSGDGLLRCSFNSKKSRTYFFTYIYQNKVIIPLYKTGPNYVNYVPGNCNEKYPEIIYPEDDEADVSKEYVYTIQCNDQYNNKVNKGGDAFSSSISLYIYESEVTIDIESTIQDFGNGSYRISFIPPLIGEYSIYTYLNGNKYGEENIFNLTGASTCTEDQYKCPNVEKCVSDLHDCIPNEERCEDPDKKEKKPFKCKVNGEEMCVKSRTECDSEDYVKCPFMNTAILSEEYGYMCYSPPIINCKSKYIKYPYYCDDGICRKSSSLTPNQRVCPLGYVLCPDFTCAESVSKCHLFEDCSEQGAYFNCMDQSCQKNQANCPSSVTCSNVDDVVCPDGTCVENEIYCAPLKVCPPETPYLCFDNSCAVNAESCTRSIACGHGFSLCSDLICREKC